MSSPFPPPAPKKQVPTGRIVALAVLAVVVFCAGGLAVIGAVLGPSEAPKKPAADGRAEPLFEAPATSSPTAEPTVAPTTEPAAEPTTAPADESATQAPTTAAPTTARPVATPTTKPQPRRTTVKPTTKAPKPKPTTKKPKPKPTTKPPAKTVTPGAFCAPEGATGVSKKGKAYRCTRKAGEDRARWRAA